MINIKHETDVAIIDKIKEHFVEDGDYTKEVIADELRQYMTQVPERVIVLVGYDGDEIVGHIVAWAPLNRNYAWFDQVWNKPGTPTDASVQGMILLETWAKLRGIYEIRMETERNKMVIARRWGFQEHGVIMTKRLKE